MPASDSENSHQKRKRLVFSIRLVAALVALAAVCLVPLMWQMRLVRQRNAIAAQLREQGAVLWFAQIGPTKNKATRNNLAAPSNASPTWSARLLSPLLGREAFSRVTSVSIVEFDGDTANLEPLAALRHVDDVAFVHSEVDSTLIDIFLEMPSLATLNLSDTNIDDIALRQLSQKQELRYLNVMGSKVTPEGVKRFQLANPDCRLSVSPDGPFMLWLQRLFEEHANRVDG